MNMDAIKSCAEKKDFNPHTCRFVERCKEGFERNMATYKCKPIKTGTRGLKKKLPLKNSFNMLANMLKNKSNDYLYNPLNKNSIPLNKTMRTRARSYSANRPRTERNFGRTGSFNRPAYNRKLNTSRKLDWFNFNTARQDLIKSKKKRPTVKRAPPLKPMTNAQKEARRKTIANRVAYLKQFRNTNPEANKAAINKMNAEYRRKKKNEWARTYRATKATKGVAI